MFSCLDNFSYIKEITGADFSIIAGPCAIENAEMFQESVAFLVSKGIKLIRAGAFKPRTSPYSFQGLGRRGLEVMAEIKKSYDVKFVSEILDIRDLDAMTPCVDIFQVGARNMQNTPLLKELGKCGFPVLLKRGFMSTREEFLLAAEYITDSGNNKLILCERGIRTFDGSVLDTANIILIKEETNLPIIADVSHAAGVKKLVASLVVTAIAARAAGIMVEVHPHPEEALSDSHQQLDFKEFDDFLAAVNRMLRVLKKLE